MDLTVEQRKVMREAALEAVELVGARVRVGRGKGSARRAEVVAFRCTSMNPVLPWESAPVMFSVAYWEDESRAPEHVWMRRGDFEVIPEGEHAGEPRHVGVSIDAPTGWPVFRVSALGDADVGGVEVRMIRAAFQEALDRLDDTDKHHA